MHISFEAMKSADTTQVVEFLCSNTFPFHTQPTAQAAEVRAGVEEGRWWNEETQGYWIFQNDQLLGMAALEDLCDPTPLFDLRLDQNHRGRGLGVVVLKALTDFVFGSMPQVLRFEGQTREDNIGMRKTFLRAGFLKEAHYRLGWPTGEGKYVASLAYAILRQDWESGSVTPLVWEDLSV